QYQSGEALHPMRLMEGADIYQIAKNCRMSVEMIEKFYAAHIKNTLDAAAINVRKPKPSKKKRGKEAPSGDPTPSEADIKVTRDLIRAGQLLKVEVLDHVII